MPLFSLTINVGLKVVFGFRGYGNRMYRFLLPVMLAGVLLFFVDIDHGPGSAIFELYGFAHLAFFMLTASLLSKVPGVARQPFLHQFLIITAVVLCLGGSIELIQPYFGRSASWRDLGINVLGGFVGVMFFAPARRGLSRTRLIFGQITVVAVAMIVFYAPVITLSDIWRASRQFPVLSDFETRFEARRWPRGEIDRTIARHGRASLRVSMGTEKYAGTSLKRSFGDWQGYSTFAFSLYNPDPDPLRITVSIRDEEHFHRGGEYHDRFNRTFLMEQGWNDVYIPVSDIERAPSARTLDLSRLTEVVIFTVDPPAPRAMYLDYIRLIR